MDDSGETGSDSRPRLPTRFAAAMNERVYRRLIGRPPRRPSYTAGALGLVAASVLLVLAVLALFAVGALMLVDGPGLIKVFGILIMAIAVVIRPRLPRLIHVSGTVTREEQPRLFALVDEVAAVAGTPRADVIVVSDRFEASCARFGWRRRTVLTIGLPLWASLHSEGRAALLAHNLGHLRSGDPLQRLIAAPALTTFGELAALFNPLAVRRLPPMDKRTAVYLARGNFFEWVGTFFAGLICGPIWALSAGLQRGLLVLSARTRQRAEYYADAVAVRAAGTDGTLEYLTTLLLAEPMRTSACRWMRVGAGIDFVGQMADDVRDRYQDSIGALEERSVAIGCDALAVRPPLGRRLRLVRSWPYRDPAVASIDTRAQAADSGMGPELRRIERALAHQQ